jgi:transcription-repair coupling factor (superfamily II helicase)
MSKTLPKSLGRLVAAPELKALAHALAESNAATASGLWGSSVAAVTAGVRGELNRPVLLICGHLDEADDLSDDLDLFTGAQPEILPALELIGSLGRVSEEQVSNRMRLIARLASKDPTLGDVLVAPIQALMQSVPSRDQLQHLTRTLRPGQELEPEKLIVWLADHGYNRLEQVEVPGDFAVRGGIIDIYLPGEYEQSGDEIGLTIRVDFFGDQIESIKRFDLDTLGSQGLLQSVTIFDLKGQLPETGSSTSLFSYLDPRTIVVLWAPLEIAEQAKSYLDRLPEQKGVYALAAVLRNAGSFARLELSQFDQGAASMPSFVAGEQVKHFALPIGSLQRFETEAKKAINELDELAATHDVTVFCENDGEAKRFKELLDQDAPGLSQKLEILIGYLHRGFVWDASGFRVPGLDQEAEPRTLNPEPSRPLALVGHHELFHRYEMRRRVRKVIASRPVDSFLDLKVGDYVVHVAHGIAKFTGMHTISKDGKSEEYLTLRFADNAALHVPAARINLIQKYIGGFHGQPQLSRLGSGAWEKQKAKSPKP